MRKILFVFGTRPEAIKLAPIILKLKYNKNIKPFVCVTAQHREMLDQVLNIFSIIPDFDLNIMQNDQSLFDITIRVLDSLSSIIKQLDPDLIVVQGDTTTTFAASLAAYYYQIPTAHLEAGLRSFEKYSPFPEEINRVLTSHIADLHFAPTKIAFDNLIKEGINNKKVFITGNSVVDSLNFISEKLQLNKKENNKRLQILVTGHRRENFGKGFKQLCYALKEIALEFKKFEIVYPVHLNPNVQKPVYNILANINNIKLLPPVDYIDFLKLMHNSYLILTDSGGVQEEAPSFGIPVLVMRDTTERPEGIQSGIAKLVGTNKENIINEVRKLINDLSWYKKMTSMDNPYGDGKSADRIVKHIEDFFKHNYNL